MWDIELDPLFTYQNAAWIVFLAALFAAGCSGLYIFRYAKLPWYETSMGRTLMTNGAVSMFLALISAISWAGIASKQMRSGFTLLILALFWFVFGICKTFMRHQINKALEGDETPRQTESIIRILDGRNLTEGLSVVYGDYTVTRNAPEAKAEENE